MITRRWLPWLTLAGLGAALAAPAAAQWAPDGVPLCTSPNDQLNPRSCPDGFSGAIVVWIDSRSAPYTFDLYAQRVNALGQPQWTSNGVAVCTASGNQVLAAVTGDGAGG